jgi:hypothetical protein
MQDRPPHSLMIHGMSASERESRRQSCLEDLEDKISNVMKRSDADEASFCCFSDIKHIWGRAQLLGVLDETSFSDAQRLFIRKNSLRFLSFVVYSRIAESGWYSTCREFLFSPPDSDHGTVRDENLPLSDEHLERLGFRQSRIRSGRHYQYHFIPAELDFSTDSGIQKLESRVRLPFEFRARRVERGGFGVVEV